MRNRPPLPLRVLAVFDNACNLVAADGRVFALVTRSVGDGPLNIVVDGRLPHPLPPAGATAWLSAESLSLGEIEIDLACADWNPRPDWEALRGRYAAICAHAPEVARAARSMAPPASLLALEGDTPTEPAAARVLGVFRQALSNLRFGEMWPPSRLATAAARLAGLGWGLTPCGDDWLAGLLTWAWLAHPQPAEVGAAVVDAAASRTTALGAAFLRSAAQGECDAAWQDLLSALAWGGPRWLTLPNRAIEIAATSTQSPPSWTGLVGAPLASAGQATAVARYKTPRGKPSDLGAAVRGVLAHGATSGADRLAGFLYPFGRCPIPSA